MNSRAYSAVFAGLVFACGLITGLLADHLWEGHSVRAVSVSSESRPHVIEMVRQELALTDEQTRKVEAILDDASQQFNTLHTQAHGVRQQSMERIRAILTEQQKPKFEAAVARLQKTISNQ